MGRNSITLNGLAMQGKDKDGIGVQWQLDAQDLSQLHKDLNGNLRGSGNLKGGINGTKMTLSISDLAGNVKDYAITARGEIKHADGVFDANNLGVGDCGQSFGVERK